jgi:hypothetical protein
MTRETAALSLLVLLITGCSDTSSNASPQEPVSAEELAEVEPAGEVGGSLEDLSEIEVNQGIYNVTVTIPNLLDGMEMTQEEVDAAVEEEGWVSGRLNEDGSTTYVIPSDLYEQYLDEMRISVQESVDELIADEPAIYKEISFNGGVTKFDVVVDRYEFENAFVSIATFSLGLQGSFFQFFSGVQEENMKVTINYIDEENGEVFQSDVWPDDLEE